MVKRIEFSPAQYRAMTPIMQEAGMQPTMFPALSRWEASDLRDRASRGLPTATTRQYITREAILKKLEAAIA